MSCIVDGVEDGGEGGGEDGGEGGVVDGFEMGDGDVDVEDVDNGDVCGGG